MAPFPKPAASHVIHQTNNNPVNGVRLWQRLDHRLINDVTEGIKCVPIEPEDLSESEKSPSDGASKVSAVKEQKELLLQWSLV